MWFLYKGGISYPEILKDYKLLTTVPNPPTTWTFYSMYEAAHYTTCTLYYFFDSRQGHTDFWMMLLHHVAVLSVAYISLRVPPYATIQLFRIFMSLLDIRLVSCIQFRCMILEISGWNMENYFVI